MYHLSNGVTDGGSGAIGYQYKPSLTIDRLVTMPRSQLEITTSSVLRLVKEETSYHNEIEQQEQRLAKLEKGEGGDDENKEYLLKQEVCTST